MDMPDELDIRIHGRGGQGVVTLAALLVDSAFEDGWNVLGFPSFGTERTGAPVAAFVRLSRGPIRDRSEVRRPGVIIVQDATLVGAVDLLQGLTPGGVVLANAEHTPAALKDVRVEVLPATELAMRILGVPKTNTAMLGLFARATGLVSIDSVAAAIRRWFSGGVAARNEELARAAFEAAGEREAVA
jgi:pyruvate ferredoxin oxidoreductase gamma subunit